MLVRRKVMAKIKFPFRIRSKGATLVMVIILALIGLWFFKGEAFLVNLLVEESPSKYLEKQAQRLKGTDPQAARALENLARQGDMNEWAARAFQAQEKVSGLSGVRTLARKIDEGLRIKERAK